MDHQIGPNQSLETHLPRHEGARIAVLRARQIVEENNLRVQELRGEFFDEAEMEMIFESERQAEEKHLKEMREEETIEFEHYKIRTGKSVLDYVGKFFNLH